MRFGRVVPESCELFGARMQASQIGEGDVIRARKSHGHWPADIGGYGREIAASGGKQTLPALKRMGEFLALENGHAPLQVFGTRLAAPREPGVPETYPARWDAGLRWRHVVHHQGVCYRVDALNREPFDVQWKVLADYALHLKLWKAGITAECHEFNALEVAAGGISRRFDAALYGEEWRMKRAVLGALDAVIQAPWLVAKWAYKRAVRWR